jgi:hypothetical protein
MLLLVNLRILATLLNTWANEAKINKPVRRSEMALLHIWTSTTPVGS